MKVQKLLIGAAAAGLLLLTGACSSSDVSSAASDGGDGDVPIEPVSETSGVSSPPDDPALWVSSPLVDYDCAEVAPAAKVGAVSGWALTHSYNVTSEGWTSCEYRTGDDLALMITVMTGAVPDDFVAYFGEILDGRRLIWKNRVAVDDLGDWAFADEAATNPPASGDPHLLMVGTQGRLIEITDYMSDSIDRTIAIGELVLANL